jgi:GntR family transcriptional regulator/MocR family aminotransferase
MICQFLKDQVKSIAMEDPGYIGARAVFNSHNLKISPASVRDDGIDICELNNTNAVYVTPSHQYPLGIVMPIAKRVRLLEWAEKNNALIIEDDYNSHFRYNTRPIPALQGISSSNRVIYLGSFTKCLLPTLRIAFIVLPMPVLKKFTDMFKYYHSTVPYLSQKTLELFMARDHWDRHLRKMNQIYKKKHDLIITTLEEIMGNYITVYGKNAGLHIVVKVHNNLCEEKLVKNAASLGVKVSSLSEHFLRPPIANNGMVLLSFSGIHQNDVVPGIKLLYKAWFEG